MQYTIGAMRNPWHRPRAPYDNQKAYEDGNALNSDGEEHCGSTNCAGAGREKAEGGVQ